MKAKQILTLGLFTLILISVITNPNIEQHTDKIFQSVVNKEELNNSTPFEAIFIPIAKNMIKENIDYKNYVLFSITKRDEKQLSLGLFGNVFTKLEQGDFALNDSDEVNSIDEKQKKKNNDIKLDKTLNKTNKGYDIWKVEEKKQDSTKENYQVNIEQSNTSQNKNEAIKQLLNTRKVKEYITNPPDPNKIKSNENKVYKTKLSLPEIKEKLEMYKDVTVILEFGEIYAYINNVDCKKVYATEIEDYIELTYTWECD